MSLLSKPSFLAHIINGLFLLFVIILLVNKYGIGDHKLETIQQIYLLLLLSIAVGIHGLSHLGLEIFYKFNPLEYEKSNNDKKYKKKQMQQYHQQMNQQQMQQMQQRRQMDHQRARQQIHRGNPIIQQEEMSEEMPEEIYLD